MKEVEITTLSQNKMTVTTEQKTESTPFTTEAMDSMTTSAEAGLVKIDTASNEIDQVPMKLDEQTKMSETSETAETTSYQMHSTTNLPSNTETIEENFAVDAEMLQEEAKKL